jgi:hypothetical protein
MGFFITTPELKASYKKYLEMYTNEQSEYNLMAFNAFKDRLMDRISKEEYNEFLHELHCEEWYNECSRACEILMTKEDIQEMMRSNANDNNIDYIGSLYDLNEAILTQSIKL